MKRAGRRAPGFCRDHALTDPETTVLDSADALATIAVKNLNAAKTFYEGKLGLKQAGARQEGTVTYSAGHSRVLVYESQFAGTNKATAMTWLVGDQVDAVVCALKGKGVSFEHYDLPGLTLRGDVHESGAMKAAWFKDPDGNIIAVVSG
jgi:catechol 2,3-dioxygenase-like lactoylglutathione lyase family enzyme